MHEPKCVARLAPPIVAPHTRAIAVPGVRGSRRTRQRKEQAPRNVRVAASTGVSGETTDQPSRTIRSDSFLSDRFRYGDDHCTSRASFEAVKRLRRAMPTAAHSTHRFEVQARAGVHEYGEVAGPDRFSPYDAPRRVRKAVGQFQQIGNRLVGILLGILRALFYGHFVSRIGILPGRSHQEWLLVASRTGP